MKNSNLNPIETAQRAHRRVEAMACHEIESNPLDAEDIAMFEMFDREGFSDEQRVAHIAKLAQQDSDNVFAAE